MTGGVMSGLSGNDAKTVLKDTLKSAAAGAAIGVVFAGIGYGIKSLRSGGTTSSTVGSKEKIATGDSDITSNVSQSFPSKGYNPQPGERTINGYVKNNANPEISLTTKSSGFNNNNGEIGGVFKRFGAESHGGVTPHVHQPQRNVAPNGNIYGSVGTKTANGGVTSPSTKDVKQLYEYLNNGKYQ